jgi:hypothetical protein
MATPVPMNPLLLFGGLALLALSTPVHAQTVTKILDNGPDAEKKVMVIIGDGYAQADIAGYQQYVQETVIDGLFAQDQFFRAHHTAFNVYRVDLVSPESGVSIRRYTPASCETTSWSDDVVNTSCTSTSTPACYTHDTALDFVYTGCWGRCWMEGSANTATTLKAILDELVPKRDLEIRILNVLTGGGGGCGNAGWLNVTSNTTWKVLAHEMGHMVSTLFDEYEAGANASKTYVGGLNMKNCSTSLDKETIAWSSLLTPGISLPTVFNPLTMDEDETVGAFEGCNTFGFGIYRPVHDCMMNHNENEFCPVCRNIMSQTLAGFPDALSDYAFYANYPGAACKAAGGAALSYTTGANISNPTASSASVLCPTRRVQDGIHFTNRLLGTAYVVDQHPTENVCCQLFARTPNGVAATGANVCSTGNSSAMQQLKLDLPKVRMDYTFAHFALQCSLPAASSGNASSVLTYRIAQQYY